MIVGALEHRTIWFHIGFHKTGTSSIQNVFNDARDVLSANGVLFPRVGFSRPVDRSSPGASHGHGLIANMLRRDLKIDSENKVLAELIDEIVESNLPIVFVSSELLATPGHAGTARNVIRLISFLNDKANSKQSITGGAEIVYEPRILVFVRRQDSWIDSLYREMLCWSGIRETRDLREFIKEEGINWLDYKARLLPWREAFGDSSIYMYSYEEAIASNGLLAKTCDIIGLDNQTIDSLAVHSETFNNPSLETELVDLMRAINSQADYSNIEKSKISYDLLSGIKVGSPTKVTLLDKKTWYEVRDICASKNLEIQKDLAPTRCESLLFPKAMPSLAYAKQAIDFESAKTLIKNLRFPGFDETQFDKNGCFGIITTLRQSVHHTLEFVHYHLNIGTDCIVLFFDDPQDLAIDIVSRYDRVVVVKCDQNHWYSTLGHTPRTNAQKILTNMRKGTEILRCKKIEWGICIDADELLWHNTERTIQAQLASVARDVGVIKAFPMESVLTEKMPNRSFKSIWFKRLPISSNRSKKIVKEAALNAVLGNKRKFTRGGFFGHIEGKSFYRLRHSLAEYNHHKPIPASPKTRVLNSGSIFILHFDCPEFNEWKMRWHRRIFGETNAINISVKRQKQQEMIRIAFETGGAALEGLYKSWFYVGNLKLTYFRLFKLISPIQINSSMFASPTEPHSDKD